MSKCVIKGCDKPATEESGVWCETHCVENGPSKPVDVFKQHEAMHTAEMFCEVVEKHLLEHRAVQSCEEAKKPAYPLISGSYATCAYRPKC